MASCGLAAACCIWAAPALAVEPHVGMAELSQTADVIFVGRVRSAVPRPVGTTGIIVTDVTFDVVDLINAKATAPQDAGQPVMLTFAGGQIGDRGVTVSGVPTFAAGEEYLVFALYDGKKYINPLVGGTQGLFQVLTDAVTGERYPASPTGRGITAVDADELAYSEKIVSLARGTAQFAAPEFVPVESPRSPAGDAEPAWSEATERANQPVRLLTVDAFADEIRTALSSEAPAAPAIRIAGRNGVAETPVRSPQRVLAPAARNNLGSELFDGLTPASNAWLQPADPDAPSDHVSALLDATRSLKGTVPMPVLPNPLDAGGPRAALCYCGAVNLFLTMEQVPTSWWEWGENNDSMVRYNQFMDIYRYTADDGSYGNNNQNEFGGYPSSQDLINNYGGSGWGSSLAVTWTFWTGCACCTITQADVFFNPAYTWWQNLSDTLDQSSRALYRPVLNHELGHSWGMQRGSCTEDYSYSQISVMHAYYNDIIEDGSGIHHPEAYAIRRAYSGQTPVINRKDVGVESYYATGGAQRNSTPDWSVYYTGDPITIRNVTVENNSNTATAGVRLRFFLSTNNVISTGDYAMGSYWEWGSFTAETYNTSNYAMTVPNVPAGQYYVGMIVTTGGAAYAGDDLGFNNATYLKDRITVQLPAPNNNSCFNATPIGLGTVFGTTAGATTDGNASCQGTSTPDVWYSFQATCTGTLALNSCGSSYDTVVSMHSACTGSAGNEVACDDDCDGSPCGGPGSCMTASVTAGTTYLIRVSGWNGQTGNFALNLSYLAPSNNSACFAPFVFQGSTPYSTCGATTEGPADCSATNDVWYAHASPCTGFLTVSLCNSSFDTILGVYPYNNGSCLPVHANVIECEDDDLECGYQSKIVLPTTAGEAYFIRIGGWNGATGDGTLELTCGECGVDADCADADPCTTDVCAAGTCTHDATVCDDGSVCTDDVCDPEAGCQYTPIVCDDGDVCTDDSCDAIAGCLYTPVVCDDADYCTDDYCEPFVGCQYTPVACDDFDACTEDSCDPFAGCQYTPIVCDDFDLCTDDACDPFGGCAYTPVVCDDFDACTDDTCDPLAGCQYTPVACDDFDICTDDSCDPFSGCAYTPVVCDDFDPCTNDACDFFEGCLYVAVACDDGLYCNGVESCVEGACVPGEAPCVDQWCDEDADACADFGNGDFNGDGDVDLNDAAVFQWCFGQPAAPSCLAGNLAGDGMIGMDDYAVFETLMGGPY